MGIFSVLTLLLPLLAVQRCLAAAPTLIVHDDGSDGGNFSTTIANDLISMHVGKQYGTKLMYKGKDLVGNATGAYASYAGRYYDLNYTSATISSQTDDMLDVSYTAKEGSVHFVLFTGLSGFYSYFINAALGEQGEFRTLYRLAPDLFPNGFTYLKNEPLPLLSDIQSATNVQDETWQKADGTYITKYDWSFFVRESNYHGVYGDDFGAFVVNPGKDYLNGDQLKQELSVHRESQTGDAVLLNMLHGTHFVGSFSNLIPEGKVFGPWLVYLNDGDLDDAAARVKQEYADWPYSWFTDETYHSRGSVSGQLVLSDGRPASGAAVFVGDVGETITQGTTWQYTGYADDDGFFSIDGIRTEKEWTLQAWANGGEIGDVTTVFSYGNFSVTEGAVRDLGELEWQTQFAEPIWQVGEFDRKALGFGYGGAPYTHGLVDNCPANLTFTIGVSNTSEWCFGKSAAGTWTIKFDLDTVPSNSSVLTVSLAGYSGASSAIGGVGTVLEIYVNGEVLESSTEVLGNDPGLYRSATAAGEWHYLEWTLPEGSLVEGENDVQFVTPASKASRWRGPMFDMVKLEWVA